MFVVLSVSTPLPPCVDVDKPRPVRETKRNESFKMLQDYLAPRRISSGSVWFDFCIKERFVVRNGYHSQAYIMCPGWLLIYNSQAYNIMCPGWLLIYTSHNIAPGQLILSWMVDAI